MALRKRTQGRVLALQALCLFDAMGDDFTPRLDDFLRDAQVYADLGWTEPPSNAVLQLARRWAAETWVRRGRYDELLNQNVPKWSVERMPPVDRNVLRLALHELCEEPATPPQVVINEAVELAKRFGGAESAGFVNGVLDMLRHQISEQRLAAAEQEASAEAGGAASQPSDVEPNAGDARGPA